MRDMKFSKWSCQRLISSQICSHECFTTYQRTGLPLLDTGDEGTTIFQNVTNHSLNNTESQLSFHEIAVYV